MSNTVKDGGTAFPLPASEYGGNGPEWGMSLRDYFAAKSLQGMLANQHQYKVDDESMFARDAYVLADAMLAEREKRETAPIQEPAEEEVSEVPHRYCRPDCAHEDRDYASEADKKAGWPWTCRKCGFDLPF